MLLSEQGHGRKTNCERVAFLDATEAATMRRRFRGQRKMLTGLVAGGIGGGALLLLILDGLVRLLGRYSRLHYRLLIPSKNAA